MQSLSEAYTPLGRMECREGGELQLDESIAAGADPHTTLVIYMGLHTLPSLTAQLGAAGLSLGTPAVAVERGTTPQQRAVYATLGELQQEVGAEVESLACCCGPWWVALLGAFALHHTAAERCVCSDEPSKLAPTARRLSSTPLFLLPFLRSFQVEKAGLESPTLIIIGPVVALAPGWQRCQQSGCSLEGPPAPGVAPPAWRSVAWGAVAAPGQGLLQPDRR